ncbi:MAG: hypothetical protein BAJATHORv1_20305 [Candidatus Thorarchaeota archaeon]|nr:MAG: hypothetical protein BAJATHORv1_20305 [Candidatus Thorarchaeota archaeon]
MVNQNAINKRTVEDWKILLLIPISGMVAMVVYIANRKIPKKKQQ